MPWVGATVRDGFLVARRVSDTGLGQNVGPIHAHAQSLPTLLCFRGPQPIPNTEH